jgi:hypothetical protein
MIETQDGEDLVRFIRESNRIEGILREPTEAEIQTTALFLNHKVIHTLEVERLVMVYQPGARLRTKVGDDVIVGNHYPPAGGPEIKAQLKTLLAKIVAGSVTPYQGHQEYETLHPFLDGNGRSGRAIWLWQMLHEQRTRLLPLGFLHAWYYQSLSEGRWQA